MSTTSSTSFHGQPVVTRIADGAARKALLLCGILSSLVYVAANLVAGLTWEGYSFADQTISELSALGAPSRSVWLPFGIAYDVLLFGFGFGVWRCAGRERRQRLTAAMLMAIAAIGAFWPPMHLRGSATTLTDSLHVVWAGVTSVLILLAVAFGAGAFGGKRFRHYSIATFAALLAFGASTFLYAPRLAANLPTPWLGVVERTNLALYLAWVVVLSAVLLRGTRAAPGPRPAEA